MRLSGCPSLTLKSLDDPLRDDPVAAIDETCVGCGHCGEVADLQHREKDVVKFVRRQPRPGYQGDFTFHPWVDNETLFRHLGHQADQGIDIRALKIQRHDVLAIAAGGGPDVKLLPRFVVGLIGLGE